MILSAGQFLYQGIGLIDRPERLDDCPGVDRDGPGDFVVVAEVEDERLDVAVEDQADDFIVAVNDRAPGIAADDVGRRDKVERGFQPEPACVAANEPALGKLVRGLVAVRLRMSECSADGSKRGARRGRRAS